MRKKFLGLLSTLLLSSFLVACGVKRADPTPTPDPGGESTPITVRHTVKFEITVPEWQQKASKKAKN